MKPSRRCPTTWYCSAPVSAEKRALASPMAMRDLGRVLHCDPSFVTTIADLLEKRGLARREASPADRRSKNLVLTDEGAGLRAEVEREFMARMPWHCLDAEEVSKTPISG